MATLVGLAAIAVPTLPVGASDLSSPDAAAIQRYAGSDRYETSALISAATWTGSVPIAYLASGADYPDALSAGPAAAHDGGPLLLTRPTQLPSAVRAELLRLAPAKVVIVGGPGAISPSVSSSVRALVPEVVRIAGADRYETSATLASERFSAGLSKAYVARGDDFADALSVGAAAANRGSPVLLVERGSVPAPIRSALESLAPDQVVVSGGPAVITDDVLLALEGIAADVTRVFGIDRYETARAIAAATFDDSAVAIVANGLNFPDGLSSIPMAARQGAPLLLTQARCAPDPTVLAAEALGVSLAFAVGGPAVVSATAATLLPCPPPAVSVNLPSSTHLSDPGYALVDGVVQHLPMIMRPLTRLAAPAGAAAGVRVLAVDLAVEVPLRHAFSLLAWCHPRTTYAQDAPSTDQFGMALVIGQNPIPGSDTQATVSRRIVGRIPVDIPAGEAVSCEVQISPRTEGFEASWIRIRSGQVRLAPEPVVTTATTSGPTVVGSGAGTVPFAYLATAAVEGAWASEIRRADADVSLSNCYAGYGACEVEGFRDATVDAWVELIRLRGDGSTCGVARGVVTRIVITPAVHHLRAVLPPALEPAVQPCGEKALSRIVLVHVAGNSVNVEGTLYGGTAPQSASWLRAS